MSWGPSPVHTATREQVREWDRTLRGLRRGSSRSPNGAKFPIRMRGVILRNAPVDDMYVSTLLRCPVRPRQRHTKVVTDTFYCGNQTRKNEYLNDVVVYKRIRVRRACQKYLRGSRMWRARCSTAVGEASCLGLRCPRQGRPKEVHRSPKLLLDRAETSRPNVNVVELLVHVQHPTKMLAVANHHHGCFLSLRQPFFEAIDSCLERAARHHAARVRHGQWRASCVSANHATRMLAAIECQYCERSRGVRV